MKVQMPKEIDHMYAVEPNTKNAHLVLEQRSEKTRILKYNLKISNLHKVLRVGFVFDGV